MRLNKMKITTILLLVLALGFMVTGCSKKAPAQANVPANTPPTDTAADITVDTVTTNPDIGTLDNISVSDEIPQ